MGLGVPLLLIFSEPSLANQKSPFDREFSKFAPFFAVSFYYLSVAWQR